MPVFEATSQNLIEIPEPASKPKYEKAIMTPLEAALKYNELGWVTIPIHPQTKKPLIKWKRYQTIRPEIKTIRKWYATWPNANIALICGKISGIFALDLDSPEAIEFYENAYDPDLQQTICQRTGRGLHALYHLGDKNVPLIRGVADKIDLKGEKSYILVEPSVHPNGRPYKWINANPLDGPDSLVDLLDCPTAIWRLIEDYKKFKGLSIDDPYGRKNVEGWEQEALMGVCEGARDDTAAKLAGLYLRKGMTMEQAELLLQQWNLKNLPPLSQEDIQKCVNSIYRSHEEQKKIFRTRKENLEKARREHEEVIKKANEKYNKTLEKAGEEHKKNYQAKEKEREEKHKEFQKIVEKTYVAKVNKIKNIVQNIVILHHPDDDNSYEIHFKNGKQVTCRIEDLTSYRLFTNKVAEGTRLILPPLKKKEWFGYLQEFMDSATEKNVDPYETIIGTINEIIENWAEEWNKWQASEHSSEVKALRDCCVVKEGKIYFALSLLQEALSLKKAVITRSKLCVLLRKNGFVPSKPVRSFDKATQVRTWEIAASAFKSI